MSTFERILMVGGKTNSLGRASEVIETVRNDQSRLSELFDCIYADDAWVRMRAIDSFEKIIKDEPQLVKPYLTRIFDELTFSDQPSIQWHLAQIFSEVELSDKQQTRAIDWLKSKLETVDVDWIVSVDAMKALLYFHSRGLFAASELKRLFDIQAGHKSNAVRKKAAKLQQEIASHGLPSIGAPATRALTEAGITKARQLKKYSEKDLLAMHGIGPKAIRLLQEAGVELKEE